MVRRLVPSPREKASRSSEREYAHVSSRKALPTSPRHRHNHSIEDDHTALSMEAKAHHKKKRKNKEKIIPVESSRFMPQPLSIQSPAHMKEKVKVHSSSKPTRSRHHSSKPRKVQKEVSTNSTRYHADHQLRDRPKLAAGKELRKQEVKRPKGKRGERKDLSKKKIDSSLEANRQSSSVEERLVEPVALPKPSEPLQTEKQLQSVHFSQRNIVEPPKRESPADKDSNHPRSTHDVQDSKAVSSAGDDDIKVGAKMFTFEEEILEASEHEASLAMPNVEVSVVKTSSESPVALKQAVPSRPSASEKPCMERNVPTPIGSVSKRSKLQNIIRGGGEAVRRSSNRVEKKIKKVMDRRGATPIASPSLFRRGSPRHVEEGQRKQLDTCQTPVSGMVDVSPEESNTSTSELEQEQEHVVVSEEKKVESIQGPKAQQSTAPTAPAQKTANDEGKKSGEKAISGVSPSATLNTAPSEQDVPRNAWKMARSTPDPIKTLATVREAAQVGKSNKADCCDKTGTISILGLEQKQSDQPEVKLGVSTPAVTIQQKARERMKKTKQAKLKERQTRSRLLAKQSSLRILGAVGKPSDTSNSKKLSPVQEPTDSSNHISDATVCSSSTGGVELKIGKALTAETESLKQCPISKHSSAKSTNTRVTQLNKPSSITRIAPTVENRDDASSDQREQVTEGRDTSRGKRDIQPRRHSKQFGPVRRTLARFLHTPVKDIEGSKSSEDQTDIEVTRLVNPSFSFVSASENPYLRGSYKDQTEEEEEDIGDCTVQSGNDTVDDVAGNSVESEESESEEESSDEGESDSDRESDASEHDDESIVSAYTRETKPQKSMFVQGLEWFAGTAEDLESYDEATLSEEEGSGSGSWSDSSGSNSHMSDLDVSFTGRESIHSDLSSHFDSSVYSTDSGSASESASESFATSSSWSEESEDTPEEKPEYDDEVLRMAQELEMIPAELVERMESGQNIGKLIRSARKIKSKSKKKKRLGFF